MDWQPFTSALDPIGRRMSADLLQSGMLQVFQFTLVLFRLSGLMFVAPGFSHSAIPVNIRLFLMTALAFLITPNLNSLTRDGFVRLDANANGSLEWAEIPEVVQPRITMIRQSLNGEATTDHAPVRWTEFKLATEFPHSVLDYVWIVAAELGLGLLLGLGTMTVLASLQLAGQIIDQQTGLGLGEVFNPELNSSGSMTGETLYLVGGILFLMVGGQQLLLNSLIDTFRTFPVGQGMISSDAIQFVSELVHRSLIIALQVSAPLLATMTIVSLSMGFLGHTVPQINILVFGFPIRMLSGLFVLGVALSGIGSEIIDQLPVAVHQLREVLSGLPAPQ